jgi:hypothetical protein
MQRAAVLIVEIENSPQTPALEDFQILVQTLGFAVLRFRIGTVILVGIGPDAKRYPRYVTTKKLYCSTGTGTVLGQPVSRFLGL